jgi:hypothetical protein
MSLPRACVGGKATGRCGGHAVRGFFGGGVASRGECDSPLAGFSIHAGPTFSHSAQQSTAIKPILLDRAGPLGLFVGRMDEPSQRRPAQVRAMVDVAASKLVFRVENEVRRQPFRGKSDRCTNPTLLPGMAQ